MRQQGQNQDFNLVEVQHISALGKNGEGGMRDGSVCRGRSCPSTATTLDPLQICTVLIGWHILAWGIEENDHT